MSGGCYDCICRDLCQSAQNSCSNYERKPVGFYEALGFESTSSHNASKKTDKKDQVQSTEKSDD